MKRSFRAKPTGWRGESHRHYLAAKGVKTGNRYFRRRQEQALQKKIDELTEKANEDPQLKNAYTWEIERLKEKLEDEKKIKGPSQMPAGEVFPISPTPKPQQDPETRKIMIAVTRLPKKDQDMWRDLDREAKALAETIAEKEQDMLATLGQVGLEEKPGEMTFATVGKAREWLKESRAEARKAKEMYGEDSAEYMKALEEVGDREAVVDDIEMSQKQLSDLKKQRTAKQDQRDALLGMQGRIIPGDDKSLGRKMGKDKKRPRFTTLPGGSTLSVEAAEALAKEQSKQMRAEQDVGITGDKPQTKEEREKEKFLRGVGKEGSITPKKG